MSKQRQKPFSAEEFKEIYSKVPRLTVEVVIKTSRGVVLMKRQEKSWQGQWHIPGGTVLYQETLHQAVQRMAQEELGIKVTIKKLLGYIEYPSEEQERGFGWSVGIAFLCHLEDEGQVDFGRWEKNGIECFIQLPDELIKEQTAMLSSIL